MGQESNNNQSNQTIVGTNPTERYNFDVYRAEILRDGGYYELEMSNVISWELFGAKMTREELKGLADFIYKYLESS